MALADVLHHHRGGAALALSKRIETSAHPGQCLGPVQRIEQSLVGRSVLYHEFGFAVNGQDLGSAMALEASDVLPRLPLEVAQRVNVLDVDHNLAPARWHTCELPADIMLPPVRSVKSSLASIRVDTGSATESAHSFR
jgi:hypothetical protein